MAPKPTLGVVVLWQLQPVWMFAGDEVVRMLPAKQLFTEPFGSPKVPPRSASVTSPALGLGLPTPLLEKVLRYTLLPESWKYTVLGVGGNGSGFSNPSSPELGLLLMVLRSIRSA